MMPERLAELLAVRAVAGLSPREIDELEQLLTLHPEVDEHDYELALASLQLEPLPESLRERLLEQAALHGPPKLRTWGPASWWVAATAVAALMFFLTR